MEFGSTTGWGERRHFAPYNARPALGPAPLKKRTASGFVTKLTGPIPASALDAGPSDSLQLAPGRFTWPVRVYWEDTDAGGVVYHGAYLRFFERARTEYLRSRGVAQSALQLEQGIVFAIVGMDLHFDAPARLDDELEASCELVARGGVSLRFNQTLRRVGDNARIARASVRAACLDAARFKPRAIPDGLLVD